MSSSDLIFYHGDDFNGKMFTYEIKDTFEFEFTSTIRDLQQ